MERANAVERVNTILDEMSGLIMNSRKAFMNANACIVDRDRLGQLMRDLSDSLPGELEQAKKLRHHQQGYQRSQ